MALYQLIYRSKARNRQDDAALSTLLEQCRANNTPKEISGILLYGHSMFIQLLEGDDEVIKDLYYNHIVHDERHYDARVLRESFVSRRLFKNWSMAFRAYQPDHFLTKPGFVDPDQPSVYGRSLLSPLMTMEAMEALSMDVQRKGN